MILTWNLDQQLNSTGETKQRQKKLTMTSCRRVVTSLSFFRFMANLEQPRSWILDAQSVKLTFSLIVTFYLSKTENRTKKSLTQLSYYCFEWKYYSIKKVLSTKFQVSSIILTSFRQGGILTPPPISKRTPKKSIQIRVDPFVPNALKTHYV